MRIGIYEQHYHFEFTTTLVKIVGHHDYYVSNRLHDILAFCPDIVLFATMQNFPWDWVRLAKVKDIKCKKLLCIHEVNTETLLNPCLRWFDGFSVVHTEMIPLLREKFRYNVHLCGKPIFNLPYMVCEEYDREKWYNPYYVVPGRIEGFRRDYSLVDGIEPLCFLGKPIGRYGKRMAKLADKCFEDFVEQDTYEDILRGCRGIIAPLRIPTVGTNRVTKEWYLYTKSCGAFWEAVRFSKPLMSNVPFLFSYDEFMVDKWRDYFDKKVLSMWY